MAKVAGLAGPREHPAEPSGAKPSPLVLRHRLLEVASNFYRQYYWGCFTMPPSTLAQGRAKHMLRRMWTHIS